jgi:hypothetical protein
MASMLTDCSSDTTSYTFSISKVVFSPPYPNTLFHGEYVDLTFDYSTNYPHDFHIEIIPFTNGLPSYNHTDSKSTYSTKSGSGEGFISIREDEEEPSFGQVNVEQIRFMFEDIEHETLYVTFKDVDYTFTTRWIKVNAVTHVKKSPDVDWKIALIAYRWNDNIFEVEMEITNEGTKPLVWDGNSLSEDYPVFACRDQYGMVVTHGDEGLWYQDEDYVIGEDKYGVLKFEGLSGQVTLGLGNNSPLSGLNYTRSLFEWSNP